MWSCIIWNTYSSGFHYICGLKYHENAPVVYVIAFCVGRSKDCVRACVRIMAALVHCIVKVRHSQRMNDTPLSCWVVVEESREICRAHCNCMAGLGETCTHIAVVLFYLEAIVRIQGARTCTQSQCVWAIPSYMKSIDYQPIKNIDFTSAYGKKRIFDEMIEESVSSLGDKDDSLSTDSPVSTSEEILPRYSVPQPTDEEMSQLFQA